MVTTLAELPTELYSTIIHHFAPKDLQQSLLALSRAIPLAPIPTDLLFRSITIRRAEQVIHLSRRLRNAPQDAAIVQSFTLASWTVDADVFINLLALLPNIRELTLHIGPNFAPEHLEELFQEPRPTLKYLSLRFRPYVQRATYYHFMKGAYFDSMLLALAEWPDAGLSVCSVVQDPLDAAMAPKEKFAQPLVFFRLDPISTLTASPCLRNATAFRFRIPGRDVARYLANHPQALPRVELLDIATCRVSQGEVQQIVGALSGLAYLIMDGCPVISQRADALDAVGAEDYSQWTALGEALATLGVKRARTREQKLHRWREAAVLAQTSPQEGAAVGPTAASTSHARKGRHKVAMSPFTLRSVTSKPVVSIAPSTTSTQAVAHASASSSPAASSPSKKSGKSTVDRIRVLPPVPSLRSIALTAQMIPSDSADFEERCEAARAAFELGWAEGLALVTKKRALLRTSHMNGAHVVRMVRSETAEDDEGFNGLEDVETAEDFDIEDERCPLICLAGPGRGGRHLDNCPHAIGWDAFHDEL